MTTDVAASNSKLRQISTVVMRRISVWGTAYAVVMSLIQGLVDWRDTQAKIVRAVEEIV